MAGMPLASAENQLFPSPFDGGESLRAYFPHDPQGGFSPDKGILTHPAEFGRAAQVSHSSPVLNLLVTLQ
jgi:hypothetical protein